jgi:hypothetical protein
MASDPFAWAVISTLGIVAAVLTVAVVWWLVGDDDDPPSDPDMGWV